jgi:hypothetical protein
MNERRARFESALRDRDGGPLGLICVREFRVSYDSANIARARESWRKLFALDSLPPDDLMRVPNGPAVRVTHSAVATSGMLVEVESLSRADRAGRALGLVSVSTSDSVVLDPRRLAGMRVTLVARSR